MSLEPLSGKDATDETGANAVSIHAGQNPEAARAGQIARMTETIERQDRAEVTKRMMNEKALRDFKPVCFHCFYLEANAGTMSDDTKLDDYRLMEFSERKPITKTIIGLDGISSQKPCGYEIKYVCPLRGCKQCFMIDFTEEALNEKNS